jgi:cytoskeletal protein CcmA (bactofilin family)
MFIPKSSDSRMRDSSELGTMIGQDAIIEGKLTAKHAVRIDGRLTGELTSTNTITIGSSGRVEGTLMGENIIMGGQVDGNLKCTGLITLESGSRFVGDLEASRLVIVDGAQFNGRSTMPASGLSIGSQPKKVRLEPEPLGKTAENS